MKEYIEKDAAIEFVKSLIDTMSVCTSIDECLGMKSMKSRALGALHDVPAADVVEVVRCKDCRYFYNGHDEMCCINHKGVVVTNENGFCHHAKRREDEGGDD